MRAPRSGAEHGVDQRATQRAIAILEAGHRGEMIRAPLVEHGRAMTGGVPGGEQVHTITVTSWLSSRA